MGVGVRFHQALGLFALIITDTRSIRYLLHGIVVLNTSSDIEKSSATWQQAITTLEGLHILSSSVHLALQKLNRCHRYTAQRAPDFVVQRHEECGD